MIQHTFANAVPFPHLVFDDFMPADLLRAAAAEFDAVPADAWVRYDSADEHGKRTCSDTGAMGPACRRILAGLTHPTAAKIAGWLTGLDDLQTDATLYGGGLHVTDPGGRLGIHADNERHPATGLARRLNIILYCTPDWQPEWGGQLDFWDRARTRAVRSIEPTFNRAVLFETGGRDYHGHPSPVTGPVARRSIAAYYWSVPRARARFVAVEGEQFDPAREAARRARAGLK